MILRITFALVTVLTLSLASADGPAPQKPVEEGFTSLFNGKDFTGWTYGKKPNGEENKAGVGYQIKDNAIYSTVKDGGNLYTEKEYANFVLRLEFMVSPGGNNGVGLRAPLEGSLAIATRAPSGKSASFLYFCE